MLLYEFKHLLYTQQSKTVWLTFPEEWEAPLSFQMEQVCRVSRQWLRRESADGTADFCQLRIRPQKAGAPSIQAEQLLTLLDEAAPVLERDDLFIELLDARASERHYFVAQYQKGGMELVLVLAPLSPCARPAYGS